MAVKIFDDDGRPFGLSTIEVMQRRASATSYPKHSVEVTRTKTLAIEKLKNLDFGGLSDKLARELALVDEKTRSKLVHELQRKLVIELRSQEKDEAAAIARRDLLKQRIVELEEFQGWDPELKLEANYCSRLHKLKEEMKKIDRLAIFASDVEGTDEARWVREAVAECEQTFVVKHDWAAAFKNASGMGEEFRLPYDICAFEFMIGGRCVIAVVRETEKPQKDAAIIVSTGKGWWGQPKSAHGGQDEPWATFLQQQIKAISIALDAEVAVSTVQRAPADLNAKRQKAGKLPLLDFHVVDLSRRHRIANPARAGEPTGQKRRLHFRRGHWRHYETHKTWIKWMLVGNPELGYIHKEYAL